MSTTEAVIRIAISGGVFTAVICWIIRISARLQ